MGSWSLLVFGPPTMAGRASIFPHMVMRASHNVGCGRFGSSQTGQNYFPPTHPRVRSRPADAWAKPLWVMRRAVPGTVTPSEGMLLGVLPCLWWDRGGAILSLLIVLAAFFPGVPGALARSWRLEPGLVCVAFPLNGAPFKGPHRHSTYPPG